MKILSGELEQSVLHLIDYALIGPAADYRTKIQSGAGYLKSSRFYPQECLMSLILLSTNIVGRPQAADKIAKAYPFLAAMRVFLDLDYFALAVQKIIYDFFSGNSIHRKGIHPAISG